MDWKGIGVEIAWSKIFSFKIACDVPAATSLQKSVVIVCLELGQKCLMKQQKMCFVPVQRIYSEGGIFLSV